VLGLFRQFCDAVTARLAFRIAARMPPPVSVEQIATVVHTSLSDSKQLADIRQAIAEQSKKNADLVSLISEHGGEIARLAALVDACQHRLATMHNALEELQSQSAKDQKAVRLLADRGLLLSGRNAALLVRAMDNVDHLGNVEFRVTSRRGQDGIIEWLSCKLPNIPASFVEFGVTDYYKSNARFLLENRNWQGLIIGNDMQNPTLHIDEKVLIRHNLRYACHPITAEEVNELLGDYGFSGEIGILSIELRGNEYWILRAIDVVKPAVVICGINGAFGDLKGVTIPYDPDFDRMKAHFSGLYFGCSVIALQWLCERRGYKFIGTDTAGVTAFFVRQDIASPVLDAIANIVVWPETYSDSRDINNALDFARGADKYLIIREMPVIDISSGRVVALKDLSPLYSEAYLRQSAPAAGPRPGALLDKM
jgi:hypothetical protein